MAKIRVVLADDSITFRRGLRKLLESDARVEVVGETGDGLEVVTLAARHCPDVVLMDIRMPGQDGLAAAREVREQNPEVDVVVLTSYDTPALRQEAREAGVREYLLKAATAEEILMGIRAHALSNPQH